MNNFTTTISYGKFVMFFNAVLILLVGGSCATYNAQSGRDTPVVLKDNFDDSTNLSHTFILIGDAGNADKGKPQQMLSLLENRLSVTTVNSTLLFLGDNIYERGMPPKGAADRADAEEKLNRQLELSRNFKGKTIFIPGNHDWYNGIEGIKEQERLVNEHFKNEKSFFPENSCGLSTVDINEHVAMIVVDSYWILQDWDKLPEINTDCEIKTREQFYETLEEELTKNQNKTTLLAIHHPLMTHGSHGGEYPLRKHLFPLEQDIPLPVIGTIANLLRKTSGVSVQDIQNKKYNAMAKRIKTLIAGRQNVVVVSGHDHNLQYIDNDNIKQIISGSGSKNEAARAIGENDFSYGRNGYAVLQILKNGGAKVAFYGVDSNGKEALLAQREPLFAKPKPNLREFPITFSRTKDTTVYTQKMTTKKSVYRFLWGDHFRKQYSEPVRVRQASLDTLFGGLTPTIAGNDDQSRSLTLQDQRGRLYVMRALRKSGARFLQSVAFKDQSVEAAFRDTYTEDFILDFYTTAHPYMPLAVSKLAERINVNHSNPRLYFVPKQNRLGLFNEDFGNELYLIEEEPTDAFRSLGSFGRPAGIATTEEMLSNLTADAKYEVDEDDYIKARLFDMLIGDWDRGASQWRWGEYSEKGKVIYRPIPINRDHAFTRFDGALFKIIMNFPVIRHMKSYDDELKKIKWFNRQAYNLDLALLPKARLDNWLKQADYIIKNLSDSEIDRAFQNLPNEMQNAESDRIRSQLKIRKTHLRKYAAQYFKVLQKTVLVTGSDKKDRIVINRGAATTSVKVFQIDNNSEQMTLDQEYDNKVTKELWLYGLGEDDVYEVTGQGKKPRLRLMGGADTDNYNIANSKRVKIYDFKSTDSDVIDANNAKLVLTDSYERNTYIYEKPKYNFLSGYPLIGFNPDDGVKVGGIVTYTINSFNSYPLTQKHSVGGNYYFGTGGYEFLYKGTFPDLIGKWDLVVDLLYTSPNFSINYFGLGNQTTNNDDDEGRDYNRVKIRTIKASPSLRWIGKTGSSAFVLTSFERNRVDKTDERFISEPGVVNSAVFEYQNFADVSAGYKFENYDNISNPTLGMTFGILGGYKINLADAERDVPYAESSLGFTYRLSPTGNWVLATLLKGRALFSNDYEFYQAATVGGDTDLRGFRNQRFAGKYSFYQSTDLRWNLGRLKNGIGPLYYGLFGGVDYGRVWLENDDSQKWHQAVGGGLYLNGISLVTARLSYFQSSDGGRISFGVLFGF